MKLANIKPVVSEKAYGLSSQGVYVFQVPLNFNRNEIKAAVESQFGVEVVNIKTLIQNGKTVRFSRGKRSYPGTTTRKDVKKAYVTLKDGDSIKIFDTQEQAEEKK
ncbi:50S ribosomal protein L23 [Candidatus Saccharibacteria bacterium 32-49-12]|nr:MAG: 50S ribosomal protein L23 [Candidatus Saccharibacteria bacterium 32-49-12]